MHCPTVSGFIHVTPILAESFIMVTCPSCGGWQTGLGALTWGPRATESDSSWAELSGGPFTLIWKDTSLWGRAASSLGLCGICRLASCHGGPRGGGPDGEPQGRHTASLLCLQGGGSFTLFLLGDTPVFLPGNSIEESGQL